MISQQSKEIKVSGNSEIQHHPYNPKMNSGAWEPVIWYTHEQTKENGMSGICDTCKRNQDCRKPMDGMDSCRLYVSGKESNYEKLFGTPERAARTLAKISCDGCCESCSLYGASCDDYGDGQLEWLREEGE